MRQHTRIAHWASARAWVHGLLFPALLAAVVLGAVASGGRWWLLPIAAAVGLPAIAIVTAPSRDRRAPDQSGLHLR